MALDQSAAPVSAQGSQKGGARGRGQPGGLESMIGLNLRRVEEDGTRGRGDDALVHTYGTIQLRLKVPAGQLFVRILLLEIA